MLNSTLPAGDAPGRVDLQGPARAHARRGRLRRHPPRHWARPSAPGWRCSRSCSCIHTVLNLGLAHRSSPRSPSTSAMSPTCSTYISRDPVVHDAGHLPGLGRSRRRCRSSSSGTPFPRSSPATRRCTGGMPTVGYLALVDGLGRGLFLVGARVSSPTSAPSRCASERAATARPCRPSRSSTSRAATACGSGQSSFKSSVARAAAAGRRRRRASCPRCATCRSRCRRARCSASSAATAPASPPCCGRSPASSPPTEGRVIVRGRISTLLSPWARLQRRAHRSREHPPRRPGRGARRGAARRAHRLDRRLRPARRVHRLPGQGLLVGHAQPPRLRGRRRTSTPRSC